jgi:hypothetical protein
VGTAGTREVYFQVSGSYVVYDVGAELDMNGASASVEFEIWRASTGGAGVVLNSLVASTSAAFSGNGVTRRRVPLSATLTSGTYLLVVRGTSTSPFTDITVWKEDNLPWSPTAGLTVLDGFANQRTNSILPGIFLNDGPAPCADSDGDGQNDASCGGDDCDDSDPLVFDGASERCNNLDDDCDGTPDEGAPDADGDAVCDAFDVCAGDDATGDTDGDAVCNDLDVCDGDDASGDSDGDFVCNDVDLCDGDDATGDDDGDGVCFDLDVCLGDDATGDADADGTCDDVDLCAGDDSLGDVDVDGICDVPRITVQGTCPGTFDILVEHVTVGGRWAIGSTDAPAPQLLTAGGCAGTTHELGALPRRRAGGTAANASFTLTATMSNPAQCPAGIQLIDFETCLMSNLESALP